MNAGGFSAKYQSGRVIASDNAKPLRVRIMRYEDVRDLCKKKVPVFRGDNPANNDDNPVNQIRSREIRP